MRILVTGERGYIGTVLVPMLLERDYEVCGLDSDLFERCTFFGKIADIESLRKDIRDIRQEDLRGFDAIIHLAGLSNDPLGDLNPSITHDINCAATLRLGALAKQAGVKRFIFSSSCSTYGAAGNDAIDETAEFNPYSVQGGLPPSYKHEGFWQCMDTLRDKKLLQSLWDGGNPPWTL